MSNDHACKVKSDPWQSSITMFSIIDSSTELTGNHAAKEYTKQEACTIWFPHDNNYIKINESVGKQHSQVIHKTVQK